MRKTKVILDKPIFCGAAILDLSKIHMFNFHFNYVKKKWEKVQVLYSDTDSLILEIQRMIFFKTRHQMWKNGLIPPVTQKIILP